MVHRARTVVEVSTSGLDTVTTSTFLGVAPLYCADVASGGGDTDAVYWEGASVVNPSARLGDDGRSNPAGGAGGCNKDEVAGVIVELSFHMFSG